MPGTKKVSYLPSLKALDTGKYFALSDTWNRRKQEKIGLWSIDSSDLGENFLQTGLNMTNPQNYKHLLKEHIY